MERLNLSEGIERLEAFSGEICVRLGIVLDRLIGPRPCDKAGVPSGPGVMGTMDNVAQNIYATHALLSELESIVGGSPPVACDKGVPPNFRGKP